MSKVKLVKEEEELNTSTERELWARLEKTVHLHKKSMERVRQAHTELMHRCSSSSDPDVREAYATLRAAEKLENVLGGGSEP